MILLAIVCVISEPSRAHAVTLLTDSNGILIGATGVDVNGTLYDVEFLDGTCQNVFTGCNEPDDLPFTISASYIASQALLNQVFVDGPQGLFDIKPVAYQGMH